MRIIPNRIKNAIKCLMGKSLQAPTPTVHEYKLFLDDEKRFAGKNVIVTGGTGAIGSAICYQLAACGALVGMCGRNEEKIKSTIAKIANESPCVASKLVPVVLDVNNDEQVESAVDWFVSKYGKLDAFVNNAGGQPGRVGGMSPYLHEQDISQIDLVLDTNLRGTMLGCRVAAKHMVQQRSGAIINMASVIGIGGKAGMCDYAAAKAGVIGLTKSLAIELGKLNVRVNCISPGFINQVPFDEGSLERSTNKNVLGRHGTTRKVADMVCYLIYDDYMTGQNIVIDGGRSLGLFGD